MESVEELTDEEKIAAVEKALDPPVDWDVVVGVLLAGVERSYTKDELKAIDDRRRKTRGN